MGLSLAARTGAIVVAVAGSACARAERPMSAPPPPGPPPASTVAPATLEPAPLAWDMLEDEAVARLAAAGMAPRADEMHAYVSTPEQFHAAPGTIEVAHTVEPMILFVPRPGWTGTAHYPTPGGHLDRVELRALLTPAAARAELDALARRLGAPDDERTFATDPPTGPGSLRRVWVRGGVWLVAFAEPGGAVSLAYRRDDRPASAIAPAP
ncbi:MAG: hypothetical protein IPL61_29585 [Myxococcales bacterium]|nr:hypothetical protein [Myxococcales bacterium]